MQGDIGSEDPKSYFMEVTMRTGGEGPEVIHAGAIRVETAAARPQSQLRQLRRSLSEPATASARVAIGPAASMVATRASGLLLFLQSEKAAGKSLRVSDWVRRCPMTTATFANIDQVETAIQESLLYLESDRKIQLHRSNRKQMHTWLVTV